MPTLRVYVGEELVKEFDLNKVAIGSIGSLGAYQSTGRKLVEKPPVGVLVSAFTVEDENEEFWFFDLGGEDFSKYSLLAGQARQNNEDYALYFPAKYNPRYADQQGKAPFISVTVVETGERVQLTKEMISGVDDNGDGTSTVHTRHEGSHKVKEPADWIEQAIEKLT